MKSAGGSVLDRHTEIGTITRNVRKAAKRALLPLFGIVCLSTILIAASGNEGVVAFFMIGIGTSAGLAIWCSRGIGLPLLPMILVQNLFIYGVPILAAHENVRAYSSHYVNLAGLEVLIFDLALAIGWLGALGATAPGPHISYVFHEVNREGAKGLRKLGFFLVIAATVFQVLQGLSLTDAIYTILPSGGDALVNTLVAVVASCGFFLLSMVISIPETTVFEKGIFWILLIVNCLISAASLLLAGAGAYLISVAVGLFWGRDKVPWPYLCLALGALGFFNLGKTTMRNTYWTTDEAKNANITISEMLPRYSDWVTDSYDALLQNEEAGDKGNVGSEPKKNQTLFDRIDNLQNLLFVIDAIEGQHVKPLMGKTYALIPPLLVPRVFWPDKPRSHEGQVLLNVYFGRQDLNSTFSTYIAWGLLPEAYGNFGPYAGSIILGLVLGFAFAWVENHTANKLLVSAEGFLSLSLFMNLLNSFEMVSSVLVTSVFQSAVVVVLASMPFVVKMKNPRLADEEPS